MTVSSLPVAHENCAVTAVPRSKLLGIEMLRGLAALMIVAHHAGNLLQQVRYGGTVVFGGLFGEFHLGVDFFFVLSGFIISWVHWDDLGHRDRLKHYALRRFTRIYPAYWALLLPLTALYHFFPTDGAAEKQGWINFVVSFLLVPSNHMLILGVAWTLVFEIAFYVVFGLLLVAGRKAIALLYLWAVAIGFYAYSGLHNFWLDFILNPYNLEFLMGIAAANLLRRNSIAYAWLFLIGGVGAFLICMVSGVALTFIADPVVSRIIFGLSAMLAILGAVELERSGRLQVAPRAQVLGAMSYSLYLVHPVAESLLLYTLWHRLFAHLPLPVVFVVLVCFAVFAGYAFHRLIEVPVTNYVRRRLHA